MAKENPPAKDPQVAFDLGDEASDPPPDRTGAAKKARAKPPKPDGKLVKNRDGGGGAAFRGPRRGLGAVSRRRRNGVVPETLIPAQTGVASGEWRVGGSLRGQQRRERDEREADWPDDRLD